MKKLRAIFEKRESETIEAFHFRVGQASGVLGLSINAGLFVLKVVIGVLSSSISIIADGVNNLTDCFSSAIMVLSFYISKKPADKEHPFGHARAEYLFASVVAIIAGILGVQLLVISIDKIRTPAVQDFSLISIIGLLISIAVKVFLSFFYGRMAKKTGSSILAATAVDTRSDVLSTSVILASIPCYKLFKLSVDGYLGVFVSFLIIKAAFDIMRETIDHLLGVAPSLEQHKKLQDFILSYEGVEGVHDLIMHDYGVGHCFASAHAEVDAKIPMLDCHELMDQIESDAVKSLQIQLVLHTDPIVKDDPELNKALNRVVDIVAEVGFDCNIHDFRVIHGYNSLNIVFDVGVSSDCKLSDAEVSTLLIELIKQHEPTYNPVITVDRNYIRSISQGRII